MIEFLSHSECRKCSLHETAMNIGIPGRCFRDQLDPSSERAILFVGQSPGYREDKAGKCFVGYPGGLLGKLIEASELEKFGDIYLSNACRCRPPQDANETQSQLRSCREWLQEDVDELYRYYKKVVIVSLGAKACYSVAGIKSLTDAFKKQGIISPTLKGERDHKSSVFFTYRPAILHPTRKPALIYSVQSHFALLRRFLEGNFIPNSITVNPVEGMAVPKNIPKYVACDIETYGILSGNDQTVFHPIKSLKIDGFPLHEQVVTVAFAWREEEEIKSAVYRWDQARQRRLIGDWFQKISQSGTTLIGQNIKFDLAYLHTCGDSFLRYWISPERLLVDDTLLLSFLLFEQRPEKGLKELATLHGIADYSLLEVTGKTGNAKSSSDKRLHEYNALDAAVTLVLREELVSLILQRYGNRTTKLSADCKWMRNVAIWDTLDLEINGSAFNLQKLNAYHDKEQKRCDRLDIVCKKKYGLKVHGEKSDKPLREFMLECATEAGLIGDSRLMWSSKTGKISIGVENVNLVKDHLPPCKLSKLLSLFQSYKEHSKIVDTYTNPLLYKPRQGIVVKKDGVGIAYPSWYPVPMYQERGGGGDNKQGGQIQGRFSCKRPARQTEPRAVRKCSTSRWVGGRLAEWDVNQDHLRMAALLSGDPPLLEAYRNPLSESIHTQTARSICPDNPPESFPSPKAWKESKEYALGKTLNFAILFRCGANTFQSTALHDVGIEITTSFAQQSIDKWYNKHPVYREWQDKMLREAKNKGFLVLPTGWSRTFGPPGTNLDAFSGEVLNFLHQAPCAQMLQTSHFQALRRFRKYHLKSVVCLQIYDAIFIDVYPGEFEIVCEIMDDAMTHPPLLPIMERWTGRSVPWAYERKDYAL